MPSIRGLITCLLVGAAITVAIAWASATWVPRPPLAPITGGGYPAAWVPDGHVLGEVYRGERFAATDWQIQGDLMDPASRLTNSFVTNATMFGWPLHALGAYATYDARKKQIVSPAWVTSLNPPHWVRRWAMQRFPGRTFSASLPIQPVWFGLISDTVLWGAVALGTVNLAKKLQTYRRSRKGLCKSCGYKLDSLSLCPECGRGVAPAQSPAADSD